uniref:IFT121-like TPR repeats domain-containing protein n=1 Tax=Palpitomonas bilix TaxID=652834 RepID=A0A7S3G0N4_9EUKA
MYVDADRKDLAIDLWRRTGDWFRVINLLRTSASGDDSLMQLAWTKIGEYYAERNKWAKASQYFAQAKNYGSLAECYYMLEDYAGLQNLVSLVPEGTELLETIGSMFTTVGITESAVNCYLKSGNIKAAIDTCVLLNEWDQAVTLAEEHSFQQIEGLLTKYASHLLESKKEIEAIELYRKANKHTEAAQLLSKLAETAAKEHGNPMLAKKLYVLSALEVEKFRKKMFDMPDKEGGTRTAAQTLDTLMQHDNATVNSRILETSWKGAEAYHFWLLAQRQLYQGKVGDAMYTAIALQKYEEYLDPEDIYRLMALTAYHNHYYGQCSKAFIRLENLPGLSDEAKKGYSKLALSIFTNHAPKDPSNDLNRKRTTDDYICIASGR